MAAAIPRLLVVGGNGFLGSAVCKAAIAKGWEVSSVSQSGKPYTTPAGHTPSWSTKVHWHAGSAFDPASYSSLVSSSSAVVHTLGILLEDQGYKNAVRGGDIMSLGKAVLGGLTGGQGNPLKNKDAKRMGYEGMNRDSALQVLDTMMSTPSTSTGPRSFVYISAADCFRPIIPSKYIETKRQAEFGIRRKVEENPESRIVPAFIRPGLMYHPHIRPISTLPAFALSLSASIHDTLRIPNLFASKSFLGGAADALRTHPLHVDHVGEAIIRVISEGRDGVVDIDTMRQWAGFTSPKGSLQSSSS